MSYLVNNQQNLNEVIFANRNKSYGAYVIRKNYDKRMVIIMISVISTIGLSYGTFMFIIKNCS